MVWVRGLVGRSRRRLAATAVRHEELSQEATVNVTMGSRKMRRGGTRNDGPSAEGSHSVGWSDDYPVQKKKDNCSVCGQADWWLTPTGRICGACVKGAWP